MYETEAEKAAGADPRRLFVYSGGFLTQGRIRRILTLAGYDIKLGMPGADDMVGVWGRSPTSPRGQAVADRTGAPVLRVEDAFLRSVHPGRSGSAPIGLILDPVGVHFDSSAPSLIEHLAVNERLDDSALMQRARDGMARLKAVQLSKYNSFDLTLRVPEPGYVLVIDQTEGDASITHGGGSAAMFREMLVFAQAEHRGSRIIVKSHPETAAGHRPGHYGPDVETDLITILTDQVSPWALLDGAIAVYTVSSQLGYEAILAGHKPRVFGQPFYAGWGLTQDENPVARRERQLTRAQLFAISHILAPTWYDPCRDRLCQFEEAVDQLEAEVRAFRDDHRGHVAVGMRRWKHRHIQQAFGRDKPVVFQNDMAPAMEKAQQTGRDLLVWAGQKMPDIFTAGLTVRRIEDGFLRSRGLGADLTPPLSHVIDDLGIYYDPTHESRLEKLIATERSQMEERRAERLLAAITAARLTKYNTGHAPPDLPDGHRILVPGQVEDDASMQFGASEINTNTALLAETRARNPEAVILYKPHPDVTAGLRPGKLDQADALQHADLVLDDVSPSAAIEAVAEVWTMTSNLGFEALIRGRSVTCFGAPFYAGWGLTQDLGARPARRQARPTLAALAYAALIAYPRYNDPVTGLPCPPEVVVTRLAKGTIPRPRLGNRALSALQRIFARYAHLWR